MNSLNKLHSTLATRQILNKTSANASAAARGYFQRREDSSGETPLDHRGMPGSPILPSRRGSTAEAAQILGCSTSLVRWLIATGELQHVERPGKRQYLLDLDEVHRYRLRKMDR